MTGQITTYDGGIFALPALLEWELSLTDGVPCGSYRVVLAAEADCVETLQKAVRFLAAEDGKCVFTGVVDEVELRLGSGGYTAEISGRDLAAVLLDNQVRAAEFQSAQLRDILANYVTPYGISRVDAEKMPAVAGFSVGTGQSCWRALEGFCRHAAGIRPQFLGDGTLRLRKNPAGKTRKLEPAGVLELLWRRRRYGVISGQTVVDLSRKTTGRVPNPGFLARGGRCEKVVCQSGWTTDAAWRTAQQRIAESAREGLEVTVLLAGSFLAAPGDRVTVAQLGLGGTFVVSAAVSRLDAGGARCELTLREN